MFQKSILILLLLAFVSCKNSEASKNEKIKSAQWLLGKWESKTEDGILEETWNKANDSTFLATSSFIKGKDTLHFESIQLQQKGEQLLYNATIKGQNEDKAIAFLLTSETEKELVFENSKNDYPKKISYSPISKTSLKLVISGIQDGKPNSETIAMSKTE